MSMEHVRGGTSLVDMIKSRKLTCSGSYEDLVNLLTNYKGTWEEVLDIALILKETRWSTNTYFIHEKQFIDTLVKGRISTDEAPTTLSHLDMFLEENSKSRENLLLDIVKEEEFTFPTTEDTFIISDYARTINYIINKTAYLDFIDNLKKFKKNPKSKKAIINLIILLNCHHGWTDGELDEVLMPFLHKLSKGYAGNLPEFTDLYKGANRTKKQAMADIKKALGITVKKSHKELLYKLVESLTDKDFQEGVVDTTVSLEDNILNFSLAAKALNKKALLQSFYNMFYAAQPITGSLHTYKGILKGYLYTLCNVGTRRDLAYVLDKEILKETKIIVPSAPVKKPEVKSIEPLWMEDGNLNYKYFVDESFISAANKVTKEANSNKKSFVDNLWLLWFYRHTKDHDVNKIKDVLLHLYKELGTIEPFSVYAINIELDIKNFMAILVYKEPKIWEVVPHHFKRYLEEIKPDLLDIPKEVLEYIVRMKNYEKSDILPDLRSNSVTKIANAINTCAILRSCCYTLVPEAFVSSYYSKEVSTEKTSEAYSRRLANFIREINNPEGLKELFKSTKSDSESLHKLHLEDEYRTWEKCKEAEEIAKKALEETLSKKIEIIVSDTVDFFSLEGTKSGRITCNSPNYTPVEVPILLAHQILSGEGRPEKSPIEPEPQYYPAEPEKPNENQKRIEDYKHGLYLGVIKESISSLRKIISDMYIKDKTIVELLNTSVGDALLSALLVELIPFILGEAHKDKIDFIVKLLKENSMFLLGEMAMKVIFGAGKELSRLKENIEVLSLLKEAVAA